MEGVEEQIKNIEGIFLNRVSPYGKHITLYRALIYLLHSLRLNVTILKAMM